MAHEEDTPVVRPEQITMSRAALRLELLEMEVRIKEYFDGRVESLTVDIRNLQEEGRIEKARALALAEETERRRLALTDDVSTWSMRGNKIIGVAAFGSLVIAAADAVHTFLG